LGFWIAKNGIPLTIGDKYIMSYNRDSDEVFNKKITVSDNVDPVVMKKFKNGMTVKDLKLLLSEWPEKDDRTGEDCEVWIESKEGFTNQCRKATPLNKSECSADLLLSS
jgi:hypothetical protein